MAKVTILPITGNQDNFKIKIQGKFGNKFIVKPKVYEVIQENNDTTIKLVNTFDKTVLLSGFQVADFEVGGNTYTNIEDLTQAISVAVFKKGGGGSGSIDPNSFDLADFKNQSTDPFVRSRNLRKNEAGQIKVNYTGLSLINFTINVGKQFNIGVATPTISTSPTTIYPNSTPNNYSGIFDLTRNGGTAEFPGRLIENPIAGQAHVWRIIGTFANKPTANIGELIIRLENPTSGFKTIQQFTLPGRKTEGSFSALLYTIADSASITSPNGYILTAETSFTDSDLTINIESITRFSNAIDN